MRRVDIDLDHAGIGSDLQLMDARIVRRRVALDHDRHAEMRRRVLDGGEQIEVVFDRG